MRDYIDIGPTPVDESCEQLGPNYNPARAKAECRAYINQLRRVYGEEPEGARLRITSNPHDFGTYHEVVCNFDDEYPASVEYAFKLEEGCENWDEEARAELNLTNMNTDS